MGALELGMVLTMVNSDSMNCVSHFGSWTRTVRVVPAATQISMCAAAGLDEEAVRSTRMSGAWIGRTLHYVHCLREEPIGVALAMQSTQEGQQVDLNVEITIPAFQAHYGYDRDAPEIEFFVEHAEADLEHSQRQIELCEKYLDSDDDKSRALQVCEEAVRLRWDSITDLYRRHVLRDEPLLPSGVTD